MIGHYSNVGPAKIRKVFRSDEVLAEARALAMVLPVVLDGDLRVLPPHVEVVPRMAIRSEHRI
jgi:hypothetical protein